MAGAEGDGLARLAAAFPAAGTSPAALVEAVGSCDREPGWRSPGLGNVDVGAQDVLDALSLVRWARASLDASERKLIDAARARDLTWREVAGALGLDSPQGAQRRRDRLGRPVSRRRS